MALVVTARTPAEVEAPSHLVAITRQLAITSATVYASSLVVDSAARALPGVDWLSSASLGITAVATTLVGLTCVASWLRQRDNAVLLFAATLACVFSITRVVAIGLLTSLELSSVADVVDVGLAFLALGTLVWAAMARPVIKTHIESAQLLLFRRVAEVTSLTIFCLSLSGATVRAVGASWACQAQFPNCNGLGLLPFGHDPSADIQLYHRLLSYVAFGLVAWLAVEAFRTQRQLRGAVLGLFGAVLVDGAVGGLSVTLENPPLGEVAHTAASGVTWCAAVALVVLAHRPAPAVSERARVIVPSTLLAYVQLTKPRVMSLLLATTAAAMVMAARGLPDIGVFIATLLGGALMSGGAGAINHYVDRDIDPLMGRTAWRPIPSGVIAPRDALRFGIALAVIASAVFVALVNVLACVLALMGLLGYVFIYTLWLKRSTPSNIVIGGAAGAIPPLVGWAAVTNEIGSLTAWYLFAIIFFWTPPHFWALSLLIRQHYERAGVPMLPVVRGEDETRRQIVLYSVLLVVLTLVLSPFGMMGPIYFAAAALLGGLFIHDALHLWRTAARAAARRLYLYSILYLFLLFTAMAVDRVLSV